MSESITDPVQTDAASEPQPIPQTQADGAGGGNQDPPETEPVAELEPKPKPKAADRRFAHLSARTATLEQELAETLRRAEAAEALLQGGRADPGETPPQPLRAPVTDIETAAAQLVAHRETDARRQAIVAAGQKEFGVEDWNAKAATLHGLGATGNQAFMTALQEMDNPTKLVAALADDTDALVEMLNKSPAAMTKALARMDADIGRPPAPRLSRAPTPPAKIDGAGVVPTATLYDYPKDMPMSEYAKLIDAHLPPHLGGKKRLSA